MVGILIDTRHNKNFPKNLKGTELNRCKKYGDKFDEIAEKVQEQVCTTDDNKYNCYILFPIVQWNRWFANSDVLFQSVTNDWLHGQFAMQLYVLHQVDVTSELLHSWWFAHA